MVTLIALTVVGFLFYRTNFARRASITIKPSVNPKVNQNVELPVRIDTAGATINAAEIYLTFDPEAIKVESVSKDNSIFELWITDEPKFSNEKGEISFAGGLPTPGFKGKGEIGNIKFTPLRAGQTEINFDSKTRALLNDGKGTAISLNLPPIKFKVEK